MSTSNLYRPCHLILAMALAMGCSQASMAQQPEAQDAAEQGAPAPKKPRKPRKQAEAAPESPEPSLTDTRLGEPAPSAPDLIPPHRRQDTAQASPEPVTVSTTPPGGPAHEPLEPLADNENAQSFDHSHEERPSPSQPSTPPDNSGQPRPPSNAAITALLENSPVIADDAMEQLAAGSSANLAKATLGSVNPVAASMLSAMRQPERSQGKATFADSAPQRAAGTHDTGRVWLQALGHGGKVDRDFDSTLKYTTEGLLLGADWHSDEQWKLGVIAGQSRTRLDARQMDGELDSWHLGVYAVRQDGPFALRLGMTHAMHEGRSKRQVAFNRFSDRLKGEYDAETQLAFAQASYNFGRRGVSFEPFAGLGYQRYHRDSHTERGGDAALKVSGQTRDNASSTFGLRLAKVHALDNGMHLVPHFSAAWKHTFGNLDSETRQQLVKGGKRFDVTGARLDRNSLSLDTGLDLDLSARHAVGLGVTAEAGTDSRTYGIAGQWRMTF